MTFLYVGLGIAMISGISAMMRVGSNVNNLMLLSTFAEDEYYQSSLPSYDRRIMKILDDYSGPDSEVCSNVKENLNYNLYNLGTNTPSKSPLLVNSCVLINREINHRVLIKKNNFQSFNLFSCYLKNTETFCPYELNK